MAPSQPARVLDTRDVDEARSRIAAGYCDHRLTVSGTAHRFHAVQTELRVGRMRVHRLRYGADLTVEAAPLSTSVLVTSPRRGHLTVLATGVERRLGQGEVIAIGPDAPFTLRWEDGCELHTVQLDRRHLESATGQAAWRSPRFAPQHLANRDHAGAWRQLIALVEAQAATGLDGLASRLLVGRLEGLVAATVLMHHTEPASGHRIESTAPRRLRRAVEYVEANADEPPTAHDIATAAHLSVRGLQVGLRRHFDTTPTELLRAARLARAHDDLSRADPDRTTVADVAYRWGFGNPGRFARYYAERYGVLPSETLRR